MFKLKSFIKYHKKSDVSHFHPIFSIWFSVNVADQNLIINRLYFLIYLSII